MLTTFGSRISLRVDSTLPCFAAFGEQTAQRLRDRFQPTLTHSLVGEHVEKLIAASMDSAWTKLYDSVSETPFPLLSIGARPLS